MEKSLKLKPPMMPNFISFEQPTRQRQDGVAWNVGLNVSDLSKEEAEEYAELMKQTFLVHWQNKTAAKGSS